MNRILTHTALSMALAVSLVAPAALAKGKKKYSADQVAAVQNCQDAYMTALKEVETKKGKERKAANAEARKARKQCIAEAAQ